MGTHSCRLTIFSWHCSGEMALSKCVGLLALIWAVLTRIYISHEEVVLLAMMLP